jgi:predicted deacylase
MASALAVIALVGQLLQAQGGAPQQQIGHSAQGRPIDVYAVGGGSINVVIVGGIHGGYEANTSWLVWELLTYYRAAPARIPSHLRLLFLPEANPDGLRNGTRFLADGVDANRNWPTADWRTASYEPGSLVLDDGGGPEPLSEPETVGLADFITAVKPKAVLSYHSAGSIVMGGTAAREQGLVRAYVAAAPGYVDLDWSLYPVTGDFAQWLEEQGIATVEVELADHSDPDFDSNQAGVQAVLEAIDAVLTVR